jgi:hypothetical protein
MRLAWDVFQLYVFDAKSTLTLQYYTISVLAEQTKKFEISFLR